MATNIVHPAWSWLVEASDMPPSTVRPWCSCGHQGPCWAVHS